MTEVKNDFVKSAQFLNPKYKKYIFISSFVRFLSSKNISVPYYMRVENMNDIFRVLGDMSDTDFLPLLGHQFIIDGMVHRRSNLIHIHHNGKTRHLEGI